MKKFMTLFVGCIILFLFSNVVKPVLASNVDNMYFAPTVVNMFVGERMPLSLIIEPEDAKNQDISYSNTEYLVAEFYPDINIVEGKSPGSCVITGTIADTDWTASVVVNVKSREITGGNSPVVTWFRIGSGDIELTVGDSVPIKVAWRPKNALAPNLVWESSDKGIAIVEGENNELFGLKPGIAYITASTMDRKLFSQVKVNIVPQKGEDKNAIILNRPENITIGSSSGGLEMRWNDVDDADGYEVFFRKTEEGDISSLLCYTSSPELLTLLYPVRDAWIKVRAVSRRNGTTNYGLFSAEMKVSVSPLLPPFQLQTEVDSEAVKLRWSSMSEASRFAIYRGINEDQMRLIGYTQEKELFYLDLAVEAGEYVYCVQTQKESQLFQGSYIGSPVCSEKVSVQF